MNVVLLWHMHQPYYVNPMTRVAMMPWVRLHAVKGYLDMIDLLQPHPEVKVNFNFAPVLVKQIEEFVRGEVTDLWEEWSRKPAEALEDEEKRRILENFFKINWENLIHPYPRYAELLQKRGTNWNDQTLGSALQVYTAQDYRDLQTWYNLSWCGFSAERRFPLLKELKKQGGNFTEEQKNAVLDIHREILALILPLYRQAAEEGRIEITTTPFFHPILPLVYDTNLARRCMPHVTLPPAFSAPEDAAAQLRLAQEQHARVFGKPARGLWPSEGSIAPEIVPLLQQNGIEYFCTDEGNLFRSLDQDPAWRGKRVDHLELFQGWRILHDGAQVSALFRERPLSDFIGFNAAKSGAVPAADYLIHNLEHLASIRTAPHHVALLALDGENAWEAFPDGGEEFLTRFYRGLHDSGSLKTLRLGDYFDAHPPQVEITRLHTGSWINSDFDIWIGDPEENKGWDWLGRTRAFLVHALSQKHFPIEKVEAAWWEIYAAEGSDWFWWYGPDFTTDCDFLFDDLFRTHLQNVYRILGAEPPAYLSVPICLPSGPIPYSQPRLPIHPSLSGGLGGFYDWVGAGVLDLERQQTAMFQSDRIGQKLYYGFDEEFFYLRLDLRAKPDRVVLHFVNPTEVRITAEAGREGGRAEIPQGDGTFADLVLPEKIEARWRDFLVIAVPRAILNFSPAADIGFHVDIMEGEIVRERYPERGLIEFPAPTLEFAAAQWFI
ncbi:MAG: glycoside hydrolase family 57 protein [Verrucomicrobium sp.]|nr:glycoside hydrolase family 57 protein [Verrucomicrobium sp.]